MSKQKIIASEKVGPVGEVISSSITEFMAESWQQEQTAELNFGDFIKAESTEHSLSIVAVVFDVVVGPKDTSHKPSALKLTREQLKVEQPHIFALLSTGIYATVIGYFSNSKYFSHLPPQPAQVHDFVYPLSQGEIKEATNSMEFLRPMGMVSKTPADELIAAAVRAAYIARDHDYQFLIEAGQTLSCMFHEDYDRLLAILNKVRPS